MDKNKIGIKSLLIFTISFMVIGFLMAFSAEKVTTRVDATSDYTPTLTVENKTVHRGQTFTIDVDLSDNQGLISLRLTLDYNNAIMGLKNVEQGDALSSLTYTNTNPDTDIGYSILPFNMFWDGRSSDNSNGNILRLTFESYADAEVGNYPITLTYDPVNTNKEYGKPIAISINNGAVTLIKGAYEAIYYDYNDVELYRKDYNEDDIPSYVGVTPTRETDIYYSYAFKGWKGIVSDDEHVIKYQADYKLTPIEYQIFYYVDGINENSFDGVVTIADFYEAKEVGYGTFLENAYPIKNRYVFSGWFIDDKCTVPFNETYMPAEDLSLYGYFVYDIRTTSIPKIQLTATEGDNDVINVDATMVANTGFNAMVLTLQYDKRALEFIGFEKKETFSSLQFDTTNVDTEAGYDVNNFKFYYEHVSNTYETGSFLKLKFKARSNAPVGVYDITFTLGNTDATYINGSNGTRYTEMEIISTTIPIGKIFEWKRNAEDDALITIRSENGMPADTSLIVTLVPESKHQISNDMVKKVAGNDMDLKTVYNLKLVRIVNNVETEVQPNSELTIEIKLIASQQECKQIAIYHVNGDNEMTLHNSERDDDVLRFKTDHLSMWAIVGEEKVSNGKITPAMILLITLSILLAIATMTYTLIIIGKNKKKKGATDK